MKPKILVVAFYLPGSGFSRVMHHILEGIKEDYEIHYFGIGYTGKVVREGNLTIYPYITEDLDREGLRQLRRIAFDIQPEVFFLLHDLRYQTMYLSVLQDFIGKSTFISYTPLDGKIVESASLSPLAHLDHCIWYTEFGKNEFQRVLTESKIKVNDVTTSLGVVPHGVDTETFRPLGDKVGDPQCPKRVTLKKELFGHIPDIDNAFIALNANRIDARKRVDITLEGFGLFAKDKPENVKLYLHFPTIDSGKFHSLMELVDKFQLRNRLILNRDDNGRFGPVSDEKLNRIYNACDVGVNTAMGEGWGLVSLEHAACGIPQIVPNHSAFSEIWEGAADFLDPEYRKVPWFSEFEMTAVSPIQLAEKLERLYANREYWTKMANAAYERATIPEFNWQNISRQWTGIFAGIFQNSLVS